MTLFVVALLSVLTGCGGSKEVIKTERIIDSTVWEENETLKQRISEQGITIERLNSELKKNTVLFKDVPCPPTNVDKDCKFDSLVKIINMKDALIASMKNRVKQFSDGSVEYEGQIAAFSSELDKIEKQANTHYQRTIDLQQENDKLKIQLKKKEGETEKKKERSNWFFWYCLGLATVLLYKPVKRFFILKRTI